MKNRSRHGHQHAIAEVQCSKEPQSVIAMIDDPRLITNLQTHFLIGASLSLLQKIIKGDLLAHAAHRPSTLKVQDAAKDQQALGKYRRVGWLIAQISKLLKQPNLKGHKQLQSFCDCPVSL
jgi:hypothetical protein